MKDLIIVGAGPAGLTSAIYACRFGLKPGLIEKLVPGGQAITTSVIENYPGFDSVTGPELIEKMKKQADAFGAEIISDEIISIAPFSSKNLREKGGFKIKASSGSYEAVSIIVSTGASNKKLGIPGEEKFTGKGVSYCATCDGPLFKNKNIAVVGGGNRSLEEAIYLAGFAKTVTIIHRRDRLRAEEILAGRASKNPKIKFLWDSIVTEIAGKEYLEKVKIKNLKDGREEYLSIEGIFIFIGLLPNSGCVKDIVRLDENGYIITDEDMKTSLAGIFAAGDVRKKSLRQIVTACADGAIAAASAFKYIKAA